jgi:hypothetical protein
VEETNKRFAWVFFLWKWLTKFVLVTWIALRFLIGHSPSPFGKAWANVAHWFTGQVANAPSAAAVPPAKALSAFTPTGLWAGTAVTTAVIVAVAVTKVASPQPSVVGTWDQSVQIRQTGGNSFIGVVVSPIYTEASSGCVFAPGRQVWQMQGRQPHYTGRDLWVQGSGGQGCIYQWGMATFDLVDHDTIKRCSLSPWDGHQLCRTDRRTG